MGSLPTDPRAASYESLFPEFYTQLSALAVADWYTPEALYKMIRKLRSVLFPIISTRNGARDCLFPDVHTVPFSLDPPSQFKAIGAYATDADPVLLRILGQLNSALSYKDSVVSAQIQAGMPAPGTDHPELLTMPPEFTRSQATFISALTSLCEYAADKDNYYTRSSFEELYSLTFI